MQSHSSNRSLWYFNGKKTQSCPFNIRNFRVIYRPLMWVRSFYQNFSAVQGPPTKNWGSTSFPKPFWVPFPLSLPRGHVFGEPLGGFPQRGFIFPYRRNFVGAFLGGPNKKRVSPTRRTLCGWSQKFG